MIVHLLVDVVFDVDGEALPNDVKRWVENHVFDEDVVYKILDSECDVLGEAQVLTAVAAIQPGTDSGLYHETG